MPALSTLSGIFLSNAWRAERALALTISDAINIVGNNMAPGTGNFGSILSTVAASFAPIIAVAAALGITISGFFLTITGNENQTTTLRRVFVSSLAALVLLNIVGTFATSFTNIVSNNAIAASGLLDEALGVVTFLEIPLGVLCVIMIIISGLRAVAKFGTDEGVQQLRRTVLFVVAGFILVYTRNILGISVASGSPAGPINVMNEATSRIVLLVFVIAVAMISYAGLLMIVNVGRDDQYTKAKSLILRVGIGLVVMLIAAGIVYLLTSLVY